VGHAVVAFAQQQAANRAVITHHHEDHSGNALTLHNAGVKVLAGAATSELMARGFALLPYQHIAWGRPPRCRPSPVGKILETDHYRFEVLAAPGHAEDQLILYERQQGWLFSGDVFLAERVKLFRGDEDFGKTIQTLRKLCALDFDSLFCAHHPVPTYGRAALQRKLDHLLEVEDKVRALAARGYGRRAIARGVLGPESKWMFAFTTGDATKNNLVRAILEGPRPRRR